MPIPKLNNGVLPALNGNPVTSSPTSPYQATSLELCETFGGTKPRRKILHGFLQFRERLRRFGINEGFQWIDGPFVEENNGRGNPERIHVVTFCRYPNNITSEGIETAGLTDERLRAHLFIDHNWVSLGWAAPKLIEHTRFHYGELSHQMETRLWKGLLRIELDTWSEDTAAKHHLNAMEEA